MGNGIEMRKIMVCLAAVAIAVGDTTLTASAKEGRYGYRTYRHAASYRPAKYGPNYSRKYSRRRHPVTLGRDPANWGPDTGYPRRPGSDPSTWGPGSARGGVGGER